MRKVMSGLACPKRFEIVTMSTPSSINCDPKKRTSVRSLPPPAFREGHAYLQAAKIASTIGKSVAHVGTIRVVANS
jgi:hypothetical protein